MTQKTTNQLLPEERDLLTKEREYYIKRLQDIERRLNIPSSLNGRDMRRVMQRAAREFDDGQSHNR